MISKSHPQLVLRSSDAKRLLPAVDSDLLPNMPVLNRLDRELSGTIGQLGGIVGIQHLFGSSASLIHKLADGNVAPQNVLLLGKPYSTNKRVSEFLTGQLGYWVHPDSSRQPIEAKNDELMDKRIRELLSRASLQLRRQRERGHLRWLLIDDGGRGIRMLHEPAYDDIRRHFSCVEQTRCGIRTISNLDLSTPVINVAESWVKLEHESPMIAQSVVQQLTAKLKNLDDAGLFVRRKALVIGYGSIGCAVGEELANNAFEVAVYDNDYGRRAKAKADGRVVMESLQEALARGGCVVGCTGLPVLAASDHEAIADGTILISASSADVEFRAWQLRTKGKSLGDPASWAGRSRELSGKSQALRPFHHPCSSLYEITNSRGRFYLVNGGFPVNFDGGVDTIPPHKIQLTRCLLYLAAIQASNTTSSRLYALREDFQSRLIELYGSKEVASVA